jgi:hypothetical protein
MQMPAILGPQAPPAIQGPQAPPVVQGPQAAAAVQGPDGQAVLPSGAPDPVQGSWISSVGSALSSLGSVISTGSSVVSAAKSAGSAIKGIFSEGKKKSGRTKIVNKEPPDFLLRNDDNQEEKKNNDVPLDRLSGVDFDVESEFNALNIGKKQALDDASPQAQYKDLMKPALSEFRFKATTGASPRLAVVKSKGDKAASADETIKSLISLNGNEAARKAFSDGPEESLRNRKMVRYHKINDDWGLNEYGFVVSRNNPAKIHPAYDFDEARYEPRELENRPKDKGFSAYTREEVLRHLQKSTKQERAEFYAKSYFEATENEKSKNGKKIKRALRSDGSFQLNQGYSLHPTGDVLPIQGQSASSSSPMNRMYNFVGNILSPQRPRKINFNAPSPDDSVQLNELTQPLMDKSAAEMPDYAVDNTFPPEAVNNMEFGEAAEASELSGVLEEFATVGSAFI